MVTNKSRTLILFLRKMGGGIKQLVKIERQDGSSLSFPEGKSIWDRLNASEDEDLPEDKSKGDSLYDTEDS